MRIGPITIMTAALLGLGALVAPAAGAVPSGVSADQTVDWLESHGYHVQVHGGPSQGTLAQCKTLGVHGLRDSNIGDDNRRIDTDKYTTVHVTVSCNDTV